MIREEKKLMKHIKKFEKLGLTSELLAKWTIIQFNQNTRTDLIKIYKRC